MPVLLVLALLAARTLSWNSLEVDARLDAQGELRVSERHRMLFTGDWNGGERKFRVSNAQYLELISVSRVDAAGNVVPMRRVQSAPDLDEYIFDGETLRWRARRVSDPPFRKRELTYVIEYIMRGVVAREGDVYSLKHDFAFGDRTGVIQEYTLNLAL